MSTSEEQILWLAALLHDIGKFRERTFEPLPSWAYGYRAEAKYNHEPFSALFEVVHLGKGTSFGLGKYRIEGAEPVGS